MKIAVNLVGVATGKKVPGYLTTDHSASSYGIPVFVNEVTGEAFGYGEVEHTGYEIEVCDPLDRPHITHRGWRRLLI